MSLRGHGWGGRRSGLLLAFFGLGCPPSMGAQAAFPADPLAGSCAVVAVAQDPTHQQRPEEQKPPEPTPTKPERPPAPEVLRPPDEQEVKQLSGVLKALAAAETSAGALAELAKGQPFTLERFAVVLGDVRSIVAHVHARELLDRVGQSTRLNAETRVWIEQSARAIEGCAPSRFENRGGPAVFEQVVGVVSKQRSQLEPLLFQSAPPATATPASPAPQRKSQKKAR